MGLSFLNIPFLVALKGTPEKQDTTFPFGSDPHTPRPFTEATPRLAAGTHRQLALAAQAVAVAAQAVWGGHESEVLQALALPQPTCTLLGIYIYIYKYLHI